VIAVLHGLSVVLSAVALRQRVRHSEQGISKQVLAYHKTICILLSNFAVRHLKTGKKFLNNSHSLRNPLLSVSVRIARAAVQD